MPGLLPFYERVKGDAAKASFATSPFPRFFSAGHYTPLPELSTLSPSLGLMITAKSNFGQ